MKIIFSSKDSLYKIFKTLEKIPNNKSVEIVIDPKNIIFENKWLWKQILDILDTKSIDYVFLCKSKTLSQYYKSIWANYEEIELNPFLKFFKKIKDFFLYSSELQKFIFKQKSTFWYFIIFLETFFILVIFYYFYLYVTPSASIYIKSSYEPQNITYNFRYVPQEDYDTFTNMSQIIIPYNIKSKILDYSISIDVENIKYSQEPSSWTITIYNDTKFDYSLVSNTRLITDSWLIFRTKSWVNIPPANDDWPWNVVVEVVADSKDEFGEVIWARWNISQSDTLYIKNLPESNIAKNIYAYPNEKFVWWKTEKEWEVTQADLDTINTYLEDHIKSNINSFASSLIDKENEILLHFQDFIDVEILDKQIKQEVGDKVYSIDWKVNFKINVAYIKWNDMLNAVKKFMKTRKSKNYNLIDINKDSIIFYENNKSDWYYIIPTSIDVVLWYDFKRDMSALKDEISSLILGKTASQAKNIIIWYDEIDVWIIRITPPWYENLPSISSRIKIIVDD